ncbi:ent-kaurene synthase [Artemisia annua]|uniref:Ent-kaurene synthase n=1 Tax=Artemisia annua TaxID=35608 RepID=A0A2U1NQ52_ARTAN|nr:ent-kaurene synthase [Artemisia annua]
MLLTISSVMAISSLHKTYRSRVVGCSMEQYNLPVLRKATSNVGQTNPTHLTLDMSKERIRKLFSNVEISVSSYDTAWVAMVPSPNSPTSPRFPECLNWLMDNQLNDGSWGLLNHNPSLLKDTLSSTLACIVALKRWSVGEDYINKGLSFIESNFAAATDKNLPSPLGFDIIFPSMLEYAKDMNINLPLKQSDLGLMLHERDLEIRRCYSNEKEAYMTYISEGLGNSYDSEMVMKYQMKNGSVLNSPSATAASLTRNQNSGCLHYLTSLLEKFGDAVPTVYPLDLYFRLSMVDTLDRLGITSHFLVEIQNVLEETYSLSDIKGQWLSSLLRYISLSQTKVSPIHKILLSNSFHYMACGLDLLAEITKEWDYMNLLEVYPSSQIINQEELAFGEQNLRAADIIKQKPSTPSSRRDKCIQTEVDNDLIFLVNPNFERMSTRKNIQNYNVDDTRVLKTTYRWVVENRLDQLKFARQRTAPCYVAAVLALPTPEQSDARISWAKNSILTLVFDDFFDAGGSADELTNLIQCVEKWNINVDTECCSDEARLLFLALQAEVCWTGDKAFKLQARDITSHVIESWLDLTKAMLREHIWARDGYVPTINEFVENGHVAVALGPIVLPALLLMAPNLSHETIQSSEYHKLYKITSTHARLLNDIRSVKRDLKEGRLNVLTLHEKYKKSGIEEEEVVKEIEILIDDQKKKLMQLVLEPSNNIALRACKDAFWKMFNLVNLFYATEDGVTGSNDILNIVKEMIYEPVF